MSEIIEGQWGTDLTADIARSVAEDNSLSTALKAAFASHIAVVIARWNARRQANFDRDNAPGFTHFIDSVNGVDTNTGLSPSQAWKTLGKLTTAGIAAGARIGLSTGVTPAGGKGPFAAETAARTLRATYTQTGAAATTGAATVYALVVKA